MSLQNPVLSNINLQNTPKINDWVDWPLLSSSLLHLWDGFLFIFPFMLIIFIIVYVTYYIYSYYYELKRRFSCVSIKNLFNGKINQCFDHPPEYCRDIDPDLHWGWCLDPDLYGTYPGDTLGPYGLTCNRWIWNPLRCPPARCKGNYPIGLRIDEKNHIQEYGWCADAEINKAIKGTYCGPSAEEGIRCRNWIWDESKCPQTCPINGIISSEKKIIIDKPIVSPPQLKPMPQIKKKDCSLICGLQNGKQIPCPPPDCLEKPEQCKC